MPQYYEDKEEDFRTCAGIREDFKACLLQHDCVVKVAKLTSNTRFLSDSVHGLSHLSQRNCSVVFSRVNILMRQ